MNSKLIALSAAFLLIGGAASARDMQARDTGWDVPGQHDADTDASYTNNGNQSSNAPMTVASNFDQHSVVIPGDQTDNGMPQVNHAGSLADSPRSGTISGISNQTLNPAINPDRAGIQQ